jgi:hypothetical protein
MVEVIYWDKWSKFEVICHLNQVKLIQILDENDRIALRQEILCFWIETHFWDCKTVSFYLMINPFKYKREFIVTIHNLIKMLFFAITKLSEQINRSLKLWTQFLMNEVINESMRELTSESSFFHPFLNQFITLSVRF